MMRQKNADSDRQAASFSHSPDQGGKVLVTLLALCIGLMVFATLLRTFVIEPFRIEGPSMADTLIEPSRLLCEKISYWFNPPQRGDIIVCHYPDSDGNRAKRVIALPGETIQIKNGAVYIDEHILNESAYWNGYINDPFPPLTVPPKSVFVMGDNRNNSRDSRDPLVGCIPYDQITGRVFLIFWPFEQIRILERIAYV